MVDGFLNAAVLFANFVLVPGIAYGAQLALGALGITLIFGILRFGNFAHGDLMALGTAVTILVTWWLQAHGVSLGPLPTALLALPIGVAAAVAVALISDRLVFRYYRVTRATPVTFMIASVGVMFVLNGLVRFIIGVDDQNFSDGTRFLVTPNGFRDMTGLAEGLAIRSTQVLTLVVALVAVAALFWFLQKTVTGKAMRAFSDNENLAKLSGIEPGVIVAYAWIIAATLATLAGVLYGLDKSFKPFTYFQLLMPMFAAAIVGGIGQPVGAIVGGFLIAFSEISLTYAYKKLFAYVVPDSWAPDGLIQLVATDYKFSISFVILVLTLLMRPTGLFKGKVI